MHKSFATKNSTGPIALTDRMLVFIPVIIAFTLGCITLKLCMEIDTFLPNPTAHQAQQLLEMKCAFWGVWLVLNLLINLKFNFTAKRVRVDGNHLYVSHFWFGEEVAIPFEDIFDIGGSGGGRSSLVHICLKEHGPFGSDFWFAPEAPASAAVSYLRKRAEMKPVDRTYLAVKYAGHATPDASPYPSGENNPLSVKSQRQPKAIVLIVVIVLVMCKIAIILGSLARTPPHSSDGQTAKNPYEAKCRGIMTAYAQKHGIEPAAYIADNTAYLEKCSVYYRDEKKPQ